MTIDANGNVVINEYKSSLTAPLTSNQKIVFPEIFESGATIVGKGKGIFSGGYQTSYGKSIENTEFFKENGGLDASDYISIHSRKHMYDPDTVSTPKKTQYGKDVNVGKLCEDTIMKPDEVIYNKDQNVMIYKKEYPLILVRVIHQLVHTECLFH